MLKRLMKLAELLAAEGDKSVLGILDSKIASQVRKNVKQNDYGRWNINQRKAFLFDLIKAADNMEFEDLSGDYDPTAEELEHAEKAPTNEERQKAFDLLLRSIDIVKEEAGLSDEEVKQWLEKNLGKAPMAADDYSPIRFARKVLEHMIAQEDNHNAKRLSKLINNAENGNGLDELEIFLDNYFDNSEEFEEYADDEGVRPKELTGEYDEAPKPILERWKNEWRAGYYVKLLKPFSVEDWRITTDDNGEFYLLQALHIDPLHESGWRPRGAVAHSFWHTVDKKPTKYLIPDEKYFPQTDLDEFNFADDENFTGYVGPIEDQTNENKNYRKVIFTGEYGQLVLMSLKPGEEIGDEIHKDTDQFFRIESGEGKFVLNGEEKPVKDGDAVFIPAGTKHNVINISKSEPFKLYTLYSPPNHPEGTIEKTKSEEAEMEADDFLEPPESPKATTIQELISKIQDPMVRLDLLQKLMDKDILSYKWDRAKWEDEEKAKEYWEKIMKLDEEIEKIKQDAGIKGPIMSKYQMRVARYGDEILTEESDSPAMKAVTMLIKEKIDELRALGLDDEAIKHIISGLFDSPEEMNASDRPKLHFRKNDMRMLDSLESLKKQLSELEEFNFGDWIKRIKDKNEKKRYEDKVSNIKKQVENIDRLLYQHKEAHYVPEGKDDVKSFEKEPHMFADMGKYDSVSEYLNKYHSGQDAKDAAFDAAKDFVRYWRLLLKKGK